MAVKTLDMNNRTIDFPFEDCIISTGPVPGPQAHKSLEQTPGLHLIFDLNKFAGKIAKLGEENLAGKFLSSQEQQFWNRLTLPKRKREWLGGRLAAKHIAAEMLAQTGIAVDWTGLSVFYDTMGRPMLAADEKKINLPDISISHSADLAACMAVDNGHCGIDIQKITQKIIKVRNRFCSGPEEKILFFFFNDSRDQSAILTKLWAAKEALRKAEKGNRLPGFLELQLIEIKEFSESDNRLFWYFFFRKKIPGREDNHKTNEYCAALSLVRNYALACCRL